MQGLLYFVCICLSVCTCTCTCNRLFLSGSKHIEMKVPATSVQYEVDLYSASLTSFLLTVNYNPVFVSSTAQVYIVFKSQLNNTCNTS